VRAVCHNSLRNTLLWGVLLLTNFSVKNILNLSERWVSDRIGGSPMFDSRAGFPARIQTPLESITTDDFTVVAKLDTSAKDMVGAINEVLGRANTALARQTDSPPDSVEALHPTTAEFNALLLALQVTGVLRPRIIG